MSWKMRPDESSVSVKSPGSRTLVHFKLFYEECGAKELANSGATTFIESSARYRSVEIQIGAGPGELADGLEELAKRLRHLKETP